VVSLAVLLLLGLWLPNPLMNLLRQAAAIITSGTVL